MRSQDSDNYSEDVYLDHPLHWKRTPGGLLATEFFWREHQAWLANRGYILRPRYREDWQPSWHNSQKHSLDCEDGKRVVVRLLLHGDFELS